MTAAPFSTGLPGEGRVFKVQRFEPDGEPYIAEGWAGADQPVAPPSLPTFSAARFDGCALPVREWHVQGLIPSRNVTLLMADGAVGKSTLALHLGASTALGRPWLGRATAAGPALYLSAEDDLDEVHRRLDAIAAHEQVAFAELERLVIVPLAGQDAVLGAADPRDGMLRPTALFGALRDHIEATRPKLLVLDTLADVFAGDEIRKVQARQFITILRGLAVEFGVAVVLIGHPSQAGMATGAGTSGNVAWSNSVRSRLYLDRVRTADGVEADPDLRNLTVKKTNYAQAGESIILRWTAGVFVQEQGRATASAPFAAAQAEAVFLDLLREFQRQGRTVSPSRSPTFAPAVFSRDPSANGISLKAFEAAMSVMLRDGRIQIVTIGAPSKRRSHLAVSGRA